MLGYFVLLAGENRFAALLVVAASEPQARDDSLELRPNWLKDGIRLPAVTTLPLLLLSTCQAKDYVLAFVALPRLPVHVKYGEAYATLQQIDQRLGLFELASLLSIEQTGGPL